MISWNKKNSGFTLLETVMVIAIIGILTGIAIPAYVKWLPNNRLRSAAQDIYSTLQLAKMEAVSSNSATPKRVTFGEANYTRADGTVISLIEAYNGSVWYGIGNATKDVDEGSYGGNPKEVKFNSRGMTDAINGFVYLTNKNGTAYAVGTRTSGVVLIRKWDGTKWR